MKKLLIIATGVSLLLYGYSGHSQENTRQQVNYLNISPENQTITAPVNSLVTVYAAVYYHSLWNNCYANCDIAYVSSNNGFVSLNYNNSILSSNETRIATMNFQNSVPETETYYFNYSWFDSCGYSGNSVYSVTIIYEDNCITDLDITANVTSNQTDIQDASVTITATNKIFNTAHAEYDAGTAVILNPGFEALENSTFEAYIEGCSNTLAPSTNNTSTNKSEFGNSFNVSLAPNPSQGAFKVKIDKDLKTINYSLYDFSGNTIVSDSLENTNSFTINKNGLPKGIYLLKIESNEGVMTKKVIIN